MKCFLPGVLCILLFGSGNSIDSKKRLISYHGTRYQTTYDVPARFLGKFSGRKKGYFTLKNDGTGIYSYDIFGYAPPGCKKQPIAFEWGFLLSETGVLKKRKRDYGYSYPVLLKSTGVTSFQGCHTPVMMDFILEKGNFLHISSSDDWKKPIN